MIGRSAALGALVLALWPPPVPRPARGPDNDFAPIARVLLSPRCRNCHPAGDAPLQGDTGMRAHAMNITRRSPDSGLSCAACHRLHNGALPGQPPGAPGWELPPREHPMVFQGRTPRQLCHQLKDAQANGGRTLAEIVSHMRTPLVLWAWSPGPGRAPPPLSYDAFFGQVERWARAGGPCP